MNMELFTVEEENLICIFDTSSRDALLADINGALSKFDEIIEDNPAEIREIAENVLKKLNAMTDAEFSELTFNPIYDDETEG